MTRSIIVTYGVGGSAEVNDLEVGRRYAPDLTGGGRQSPGVILRTQDTKDLMHIEIAHCHPKKREGRQMDLSDNKD